MGVRQGGHVVVNLLVRRRGTGETVQRAKGRPVSMVSLGVNFLLPLHVLYPSYLLAKVYITRNVHFFTIVALLYRYIV